ncbi:hypothetical protein [Helicobacter bilis]|uniref:hypothetical protein n=1 Tax=Helicobacter bilis TaxID=37372 RepID=UPI000690297F|nr:hypothetical protein [Helicobacter bilis]TLE09320.1 hypothetical protein LS78_002580 [Helicobacter bilis]
MDNYRKEIVKAKEVEEKRKQNIAKTQNESVSVNKVLNSYNLYTEGSASNGSEYTINTQVHGNKESKATCCDFIEKHFFSHSVLDTPLHST